MRPKGAYMGIGIQICGLNGCGKSTIGRALAKRADLYFIDNEELYFPKNDADRPYANARTREEAAMLLMNEVTAHENFVFSAVRGDRAARLTELYSLVVLVEVPREVRLRRLRERSFKRFGERMLPGGDLFDSEESFYKMAEARPEDYCESYVRSLKCPLLRLDGTAPVNDNVNLIINTLEGVT